MKDVTEGPVPSEPTPEQRAAQAKATRQIATTSSCTPCCESCMLDRRNMGEDLQRMEVHEVRPARPCSRCGRLTYRELHLSPTYRAEAAERRVAELEAELVRTHKALDAALKERP
jgi:hypothetical protein